MNNVIKACDVTVGLNYRLFPNRKRSQYLLTKCVGVRDGRPIFLYIDKWRGLERIIDNVDVMENVQEVSDHG